ncbi:AI-2E family transporter [Halocalculus aciditolerans]|uniref:AI-2E family transporter n=1 Tax=Halocalculus aciditolerans TaxID=1383812 RepID=A0A830FL89_9EURY|nr:AI-2E family transporter [Halocalculus aciditolerans]GGL66783.1 AI-2E family transporter [Halocalculus aciditolerans]
MNQKRAVVAAFGLLVTVALAVLAYRFIAPLTVSVFLYYSTRRYFHALRRLHLPRRVRAVSVLVSLAVPLLLLTTYAAVLLVLEARHFVDQYAVVETAAAAFPGFDGIDRIPELSAHGLYEAYQAGEFAPFIEFASEHAAFLTSLVSDFFLGLFVVIIVTYYLLVDGHRVRDWLLGFDDDGVIRDYFEAVDAELESVLFGNLLNVIAISLIAIGAFELYNLIAPAAVEIPYPALAGVLTGVASLIPVVGMKIVYLPLAAVTALPVVLGGDQSLLVYVVAFLVVAVVVVDTIPDLLLRPILSGKNTHVGLLMLAYTIGPVVLGFYGIFFAPILLVAGLTFATTTLPRLLNEDDVDADADTDGDSDTLPPDQRRLDDFA